MNKPVDHHILPQCYLKGFLDKNGHIWTVKIFEEYKARIRFSTPAGTAYEKNYFTINHSMPLGIPLIEDPLVIETKRNLYFEQKIPRLWLELEQNSSCISINSKYEIVQTIIHLKMRSRSFRQLFFRRDHIEKLMHQSIDELSKEAKWQDRVRILGISIKEYKDMLIKRFAEEIIDPGSEAQFHNGFLIRQPSLDGAAKKAAIWRLVQANWTILHATLDSNFILSDSPGNSIDDKGEVFNLFGRDKFEFYFPINATMTLKIGNFNVLHAIEELSLLMHEVADKQQVDQINAQFLVGSYIEVYGNSREVLDDLRERILPKVSRKNINIGDIYTSADKYAEKRNPSDSWK
jgi:hypothetical protein